MEYLFAPLGIIIAQPWVAGLIGALFAVLFAVRRIRPVGMAAVAWIAYCAWEYGMKLRLLCTGECNIRIDLLLIGPILGFTTFVAVWRLLRTPTKKAGT